MGNLTVHPGTYHVIADILKKKGPHFHYDGKKEKPKPLPELTREGIADGKCYSVIVEAGDVLLAHPWLAHGIGENRSKEVRMAVYCRLSNTDFYMKHRSTMAGKDAKATKNGLPQPDRWEGDYWANVPHINEWIQENKEFLRNYDNGRLEEALNQL